MAAYAAIITGGVMASAPPAIFGGAMGLAWLVFADAVGWFLIRVNRRRILAWVSEADLGYSNGVGRLRVCARQDIHRLENVAWTRRGFTHTRFVARDVRDNVLVTIPRDDFSDVGFTSLVSALGMEDPSAVR